MGNIQTTINYIHLRARLLHLQEPSADEGGNKFMDFKTVGFIVAGITTVLNFVGMWNRHFRDPVDSISEETTKKEMQFVEDLHASQIENLKYQKKIVEELSKLNGVLSVQGTKVAAIEDDLVEVKKDVKDLNVKVAVLEEKDKIR